eukprot:403349270
MATFCLVLNIFLPGFGTMLNACMGVHVAQGLLYGLLQILLAPLLIGWVWSIVYGIKIVQLSGKQGEMYHYGSQPMMAGQPPGVTMQYQP